MSSVQHPSHTCVNDNMVRRQVYVVVDSVHILWGLEVLCMFVCIIHNNIMYTWQTPANHLPPPHTLTHNMYTVATLRIQCVLSPTATLTMLEHVAIHRIHQIHQNYNGGTFISLLYSVIIIIYVIYNIVYVLCL